MFDYQIIFIAMNKKVLGLALGAALALAPLAAFASTTQTFLTLDGDSTATLSIGDSVDGVLTFNNTGNSTVQSVKVEVPGSHIPGACLNIEPNQNATGTHTASFPVVTNGATEGTWDVKVTTYGIQSNNPGANNNCDGTIGVNTSHTFSHILTLTASQSAGDNSNNTGGSSSGGSSNNSNLSTCVSAGGSWNAGTQVCSPAVGGTTPTPTTSTQCSTLALTLMGTEMNKYNSQNIALQGFLLYQHESIPWLAQGASFGYFGPQTQAALAHFKMANSCN